MKTIKILDKKTIEEIESTTEKEAFENALLKKINFKPNFNYYIVDFGGYFGLSILFYSNGRMIRFANDYQLHHSSITERYTLVKYYLDNVCNKIYDITDIIEKAPLSYDEYQKRSYFIANLLPCAFDYLSIFGNFNTEEAVKEYEEKKKNYPFYSNAALAYFKKESDAKLINRLYNINKSKYDEMMKDDNVFYEACVYEMFNHESAIDWDEFIPALDSLGINYNSLSSQRQNIVQKAYKYVCKNTRC